MTPNSVRCLDKLYSANDRIRELEADNQRLHEKLRIRREQLAAERAVSDRLLEALKVSVDEIGYIAFKCERDTATLQPSRELIAKVESMRKEK